jgi:hypothetical protein
LPQKRCWKHKFSAAAAAKRVRKWMALGQKVNMLHKSVWWQCSISYYYVTLISNVFVYRDMMK